MKISLLQQPNFYYSKASSVQKGNNILAVNDNTKEEPGVAKPALSLANFPNISFGALKGFDPDAKFLLNYSKLLKCAYSGKTMLPPNEANSIYEKLLKKPNAQSAINYLQQYQKIMHDVESQVFDLLAASSYKNKRDFQNILEEYKPEALVRLKEKQRKILSSTDKIIDKMDPTTALEIQALRDTYLIKSEKNTFIRKSILDILERIRVSGEDKERLKKIYRAWFKLPSSSTDIDAFIVKYSRESHYNIAKRLISTSVATIEHIKPNSKRGDNKLSNYLLVSAEYNNNRQSTPLDEYIELRKDLNIRANLQKYMDKVIELVNDKKSNFATMSFYPESLKSIIAKETKNSVLLNTNSLTLTKQQKQDNKYFHRLGNLYKLNNS